MGLVEGWFGVWFTELHPSLRQLHREGGVLDGPVQISFGRGLAGLLGRRLASRMGVPDGPGEHCLQVSIHSEKGALHWGRCFDGGSRFNSVFEPVGQYPHGYWIEGSGRLQLLLGVEIRNGGWHWQHRRTRFLGVPLSKALLPVTLASKAVEDGRYCFTVEVRAPLLGKLFGYAGSLQLRAAQHGSLNRTSR